MTGLHMGHCLIRGNRRSISDADYTVAEMLQVAGYRTGMFGKGDSAPREVPVSRARFR